MARLKVILMMLLFSLSICAQKKEMAQAKAYIKSGSNLENAEKSMRTLLADSANRQNSKIWLLLQSSIKKQYDLGNEKLYLKQAYDTAQLFLIAKRMFETLESFDSIDAQPDAKGRIYPKYRQRHASLLDGYRQNIYTGGSYFVRKQRYQEAFDMFDTYLECARQPLFEKYNYVQTDSRLPEAAYWAVYCGYRLNNPTLALRYEEAAWADTLHTEFLLQYLADVYFMKGDTAKSVNLLLQGFNAYPSNTFFCPRLVDHYCSQGQYDEANKIVDVAISANEDNWLYRYAKSTIYLNTGRYEECIDLCDQLISSDDTLADAYYNAGYAYYRMAREQEANAGNDRQKHQQVLNVYRRALPYLERYRTLAPDHQEKWLMPLYTIYLNLNMGEDFEEMERLVNKKN